MWLETTFGLSLCCFISSGTSCLPYGTYVWISARLCVLFWLLVRVIALGDGRIRWHSRTLSKLSSSHPASSHRAFLLRPVPPIVARWSLKITHLLCHQTYICAHYIQSPPLPPRSSQRSRVSGASAHNDTVSFLERVYCAAQVYTNVVLQFSAHNTRDREIIKHCTGKKTKQKKKYQRIKVYNLHILS